MWVIEISRRMNLFGRLVEIRNKLNKNLFYCLLNNEITINSQNGIIGNHQSLT
jgi:hypothetical protein